MSNHCETCYRPRINQPPPYAYMCVPLIPESTVYRLVQKVNRN